MEDKCEEYVRKMIKRYPHLVADPDEDDIYQLLKEAYYAGYCEGKFGFVKGLFQ